MDIVVITKTFVNNRTDFKIYKLNSEFVFSGNCRFTMYEVWKGDYSQLPIVSKNNYEELKQMLLSAGFSKITA